MSTMITWKAAHTQHQTYLGFDGPLDSYSIGHRATTHDKNSMGWKGHGFDYGQPQDGCA